MRKILATLGLLAAALVGVTTATTASAAPLPLCSGWHVNPDESSRQPEQLPDGMKFEPADLIHRAAPAGTTVATLTAGTYTTSPAPGQPSFFSVEVGAPGTYAGYATLRWNPGTSTWTMVTGGVAYEDASPVALVAKTTPAKSSNVLTFGVGFTLNPPGTVTTKVTNVKFLGVDYPTFCLPPTQSSSSASASASSSSKPPTTPPTSASSSASASASATASATPTPSDSGPVITPDGGDRLPTTGVKLIVIGGIGVGLVLLGVAALVLLKRRDDHLEA